MQQSSEWAAIHPVIIQIPDLETMSGPEKVETRGKYGREALKISAEKSNITFHPPDKDVHGVPVPTDGVYWSLSYSVNCVTAVVAPSVVGIDIEQIREVSHLLKDQIASETEWHLADEYNLPLFFRYWTAKEAVLKASGQGLSGLPGCSITQIIDDILIQLHHQDISWLVHQHCIPENTSTGLPNYIAAITLGDHDINWQVIEIDTIL